MNQKKLRYIHIFLGVLIFAFCIKVAISNGDFKVFLEASKLIKVGKNPYHEWIFVSEGNYCLYFYSPLWAVILFPFANLPNFIPNFIWLIANFFFLFRIWQLLIKYVEEISLSKKQVSWIILLCVLMCSRLILLNFGMIQMTIFLLWGSLESIRLIGKRNYGRGGILLALVINIKILPIVIIPYLLYRKYFAGVVSTLAFSILFLALPGLYTGWTENLFLLKEWWSVINPGNSEHLIESGLGVHSLTALIPSLLLETHGEIPIKRNLFNINKDIVILILNASRFFLILLSVYFLKWPAFTYSKNKLSQLRELAYLFLIIPLIFPHQQKYAFALIIPAIFYLSHFLVVNSPYRNEVIKKSSWNLLIALIGCSFILITLSTDGIIGRELNNITQHFKSITWGTLLLIIALFLASPTITEMTIKLINDNSRKNS